MLLSCLCPVLWDLLFCSSCVLLIFFHCRIVLRLLLLLLLLYWLILFLQFCLFLFYHFNFLAEFFSHTLFFSMIRTASSLNPEKLSYIGGDWFGLFLPLHFDLLHGHWLSLEQHSALFVWHFNWLCFQYRGTVVLSRVRGELLSCGLWVSFMLPNCILSVYAYSRGFVLHPALVICASVAMADTLVFIFLLFFWAVCLLLV